MDDSVAPETPDLEHSSAPWPTSLVQPPHVLDPAVPSATKRVCFYKSGDPRFGGLHVVINNRTFKTFDALLDNLSKKMPLPFGVRNITTPQGTHAVHSLHELENGKSYICSDQKKVKPLNLEAARRTLPPWNMTRPLGGRRATNRSAHQSMRPAASPALQMPKQLTVFRNGNRSVWHILTLQTQSSETFDGVLKQVSEVMKFPVRKLFTLDGRKVDSLSALTMGCGPLVASSHEPFRAASYNVQSPTQTMFMSGVPDAEQHHRPQQQTGGAQSRNLKSRNLFPSSEMFFVNQLNNSVTGSLSDFPSNRTDSKETGNSLLGAMETEAFPHVANERDPRSVMPSDDDIEKSFRINEDGSMTVEMKVRLTIKEEEIIHWTTTLKRSTITKRAQVGCGQEAESKSPQSPEENIDATIISAQKPEDHSSSAGGRASSASLNVDEQPRLRRAPTPGSGLITRKQSSVESITTMSDGRVTSSMVGAYSCAQEGPNGEVAEDRWLVCQMKSAPVPKPRMARFTESEGYSASQSSDVSEVTETQKDNGAERSESALDMCEQQSHCENDLTEARLGFQGETVGETVDRLDSADTIPCSTSCEQDAGQRRTSITSESVNDRQSITVRMSPDPVIALDKITNSSYPSTDSEVPTPDSEQSPRQSARKELITAQDPATQIKEAKENKPKKKPKAKMSSSSPDKSPDRGPKEGEPDLFKSSKEIKLSDTLSQVQKQKMTDHAKQVIMNGPKEGNKQNTGDVDVAVAGPLLHSNSENSNGFLGMEEQKQIELKGLKDDKTNIHIKTNILGVPPHGDLRQTKKMLLKQNSEREYQTTSRETQHLTESISLPTFQRGINEYVEKWLENIHPESTDCMDDGNPVKEKEPRAVFQIGSGFLDESEENSEIKVFGEDKHLAQDHSSTETNPVTQDMLEKVLDEVQNDDLHHRKAFRGEGSGVPVKPTVQVLPMTLRRSADTPPEADAMQTLESKLASEGYVMPVLEQLCSTIPSMTHVSHHSQPSSMEKSYSFPDLASHNAAPLGSSSKLLIAFLSAVALNEVPTDSNVGKPFKNGGSCSDALSMIESLQKVANIRDTEELKARLSDLQRANSSHLQSCRSFPELNGSAETHSPCPENPVDGYALEPMEAGSMSQEPPNDVEGLLEDRSTSTEFQKELVCEDLAVQSADSKGLTDSGDDKNTQSDSSKDDPPYNDSKTDDKVRTLEEGGYEDEKDGDKDEGGSPKQLTRKEVEVNSGVPCENLFSHLTFTTQQCSEAHLKEAFEMSKSAEFICGSARERHTMAGEDEAEEEQEEHCWEPPSYHAEIPQDLLDFINSALLSSTLSFSYDSKGNLVIDAKEPQGKTAKEMFLAQGHIGVQYGCKRLPSPNTSDLSDYRPETTDSEGFKSQESAELFTESEEDHFKRPPFSQSDSSRLRERICGGSGAKVHKLAAEASFLAPCPEQHDDDECSSAESFGNLDGSRCGSGAAADAAYFHTADPVEDCRKQRHVVPSTPLDLSEGVLIDKGRWLLKENHLIRRSPPEPMGMYGNVDSTSSDTGQGNTSDNDLTANFGAPASSLAAISSSDLEELAKPNPMPQLAYFSVPHGSDSDLFQDETGSRSSKEEVDAKESKKKKDRGRSPLTEASATWAKRKSSLNSFTSVQFKMPDGKVHPLDTEQATTPSCAVGAVQMQEATERRDHACGPHCPIL